MHHPIVNNNIQSLALPDDMLLVANVMTMNEMAMAM